MEIKIVGTEDVLKDLQRAEALANELQKIYYRLSLAGHARIESADEQTEKE